jgi:hypothetical protein
MFRPLSLVLLFVASSASAIQSPPPNGSGANCTVKAMTKQSGEINPTEVAAKYLAVLQVYATDAIDCAKFAQDQLRTPIRGDDGNNTHVSGVNYTFRFRRGGELTDPPQGHGTFWLEEKYQFWVGSNDSKR